MTEFLTGALIIAACMVLLSAGILARGRPLAGACATANPSHDNPCPACGMQTIDNDDKMQTCKNGTNL